MVEMEGFAGRAGRTLRASDHLPGMTQYSTGTARLLLPITCWPTSRWLERPGAGTGRLPARANASPLGSVRWRARDIPLDAKRPGSRARLRWCYGHSLDGVSDRDFAVEALLAFALCMVHLFAVGRWRSPGGRTPDLGSSFAGRLVLDRLVDDAQQEETRTGRVGCVQDGAGVIGELTGMLTL